MEASYSLRSLLLPPRFSSSAHQKLKCVRQTRRHKTTQVLALKQDHHGHGRDKYKKYGKLVDENMIVLRERMHEMKAVEQENEPPSGWMDWEKRYYPNYDSDICEAVGLLQTLLMNTRPSLALGLVALVALSVPTSMAAIISHLMEIIKLN